MDLRDVVRLYDSGSSGTLVGMEIVKIDDGSMIRRFVSHVDGMTR